MIYATVTTYAIPVGVSARFIIPSVVSAPLPPVSADGEVPGQLYDEVTGELLYDAVTGAPLVW